MIKKPSRETAEAVVPLPGCGTSLKRGANESATSLPRTLSGGEGGNESAQVVGSEHRLTLILFFMREV
jgi:hypothetical protein